MKTHIYLLFLCLLLVLTTGQARDLNLADLTDWYVDAVNGDDATGTGSEEAPFKSINALLAVNSELPEFVGKGDTVHLAAGSYDKLVVIDIQGLSIEGVLNEHDMPESILGEVKITASEVTLKRCLFLNSGLTLLGAEGVSIANNLFSGRVKDSLILLGSSNNRIDSNRFESATESCVVIRCDPRSKRPSNDNVFQENYFTHHPEKSTRQIVHVNPVSFSKSLLGKRCLSARNRFIQCAFEETIPKRLKNVVTDYSPWQIVTENEYSLRFEDCYFKRADRNTPFVSFMVIREGSNLKWYWDELVKDTWFSSNDGGALTGNKKNDFMPFIHFADWDEDGLFLETKTPADLKAIANARPPNRPPRVVDAIIDVAVYENAEASTINLFNMFEDDVTADEDLEFFVSIEDTSLFSSEINDGLLILNYAEGVTGMTLITVTATDDDSENPQSSEDSFYVVIVEDPQKEALDDNNWYVDCERGDDVDGVGSQLKPFRSIERVFALYAEQPELKETERTVYLGKGKYGGDLLDINIPGLSITGILDKYGKPLTILGETRITASGVKLVNCEIRNAPLTLSNVENVLVSNNIFSGTTNISLYLLGASDNKIQYNEFSSAIHDCVHIYWDPDSEKSSDGNIFLRNYFTHRLNGTTKRVIRVNWATGNNNSISARNKFVECAFKETKRDQLQKIVADDTNWWVVADHKYLVLFEDCYFKRADRPNPFTEFVILKK